MQLRFLLLSILVFILPNSGFSQILSNGDFSSGTSGWGCGVEVNTESTYGGSSSNPVVEVDAGAGLCQTMTGLTIGNAYLVSFSSSRRTGGCPSPAITNIDVNVSGGALSTTITRTNTTFGFISDYFLFTATSATHTLTFSAGSGFGGSTCGMIMDNFVVSFSPLPVTLLSFSAYSTGENIDFKWSTASEKNNAYFVIERSINGTDFTEIQKIPSQVRSGNSTVRLDYTGRDLHPIKAISYYRLKQVDADGSLSYSKLISMGNEPEKNIRLYPNPTSGDFFLEGGISGQIQVDIVNSLQQTVYSELRVISSTTENVKIEVQGKLNPGYYFCRLSAGPTEHYYPFIVR